MTFIFHVMLKKKFCVMSKVIHRLRATGMPLVYTVGIISLDIVYSLCYYSFLDFHEVHEVYTIKKAGGKDQVNYVNFVHIM